MSADQMAVTLTAEKNKSRDIREVRFVSFVRLCCRGNA